jgi:hydrogenase nickel incorporation protein HypB
MCSTCGCSEPDATRIIDLRDVRGPHNNEYPHHDHHHHADHVHRHETTRTIVLEQEILSKNIRFATANRTWLRDRHIVAINLMSSPGAGKTTLLERTIRELSAEIRISVIEGDQETTRDAERIQATGCPVVQINTGSGCHLDSLTVRDALSTLDPSDASLVVIENVGNLVCPALFDLGENARVIIAGVTEGEDKPLKYPRMFQAADLILLNKVDLMPYVSFDPGRFLEYAKRVNPNAPVKQISANRGDGLDEWYSWIRQYFG